MKRKDQAFLHRTDISQLEGWVSDIAPGPRTPLQVSGIWEAKRATPRLPVHTPVVIICELLLLGRRPPWIGGFHRCDIAPTLKRILASLKQVSVADERTLLSMTRRLVVNEGACIMTTVITFSAEVEIINAYHDVLIKS